MKKRPNPWALSPEQREAQREALARHAEHLRAALAAYPLPRPYAHCLEDLILQCHDLGMVETGTILALMRVVMARGQEEGRDRLLAAVANIAADYEGTSGPTFSAN